ncbi:NAD(P)-binding domain-containing protein [Kaistia geumhonensis]|uniref:L-threonate dehydrogenase n=1 Tax=Kaistia geumhonensis TaxID=410839 RepID=A0ABU0M0U8_9HYPH|nr:L-threonate dehydrogenase [Kaistia geumhonensis]MCX5480208.1 NAD(P)-binding domain-containing protein [Kaistia geumhonensis]MDQ0514563.1 3-hydroxyisobutyrate dehydrogenase [Kaistia geumhonensis]
MVTPVDVAVVGLGSMGLGMAGSLIRAGLSVRGCDLSDTARDRLRDLGGHAAATPAEAARGASALLVVVVNAAQTEAVLFGENGAAAALSAGAVVIASATMAPADARRIAARVEATGLHYLDAPISGGATRAASGELTVMASGSPAAFAAAEPVLGAIAARVHALGAEAGVGSSFKIVNQLLAGIHIAAACEAMAFAKSLDLDLSRVFEVITQSAGNSWMFENRVPHILAGDYSPKSAVSIFTKDLGIVSDIGRSGSFPLPVASAALQLFLATAAAGMAQDDDASVARLYAMIAGLDLPSKA